jgi:hypothetical protein
MSSAILELMMNPENDGYYCWIFIDAAKGVWHHHRLIFTTFAGGNPLK